MGNLDPAFRKVIEQREAEKRHVAEYVSLGIISLEQADRIIHELDGHRDIDAIKDAKDLWPCLLPILRAWDELGTGISIVQGMAAGTIDQRAGLYAARRGWLDENEIASPDVREFYLDVWKRLDDRHFANQVTRLKDSTT